LIKVIRYFSLSRIIKNNHLIQGDCILLDINGIKSVYNKLNLPVLDGSALREDLFMKDIVFDFIKDAYIKENPTDFFPNSRISIPDKLSPFTRIDIDKWEKTRKNLNQFIKSNKIFMVLGKDNAEFVSKIACSHLIETLYCLERSIFWFFNYKYNITKTFESAGMQALYYSSFFIKVAIQKFLGISVLHTRYIGKTMIKIDWSNANVEIITNKGWSADHKKIADNFFELMKTVDLKEFPEIFALFQFEDDSIKTIMGVSSEEMSRYHSDYLRKARMDYVYDYTTRESDPFTRFYGSVGSYFINVQNYCFLDGPERYNDGSEYYATSFVLDVYGGWGINEDFVGSLMKFLITNLKEISSLKKYLLILSRKIEAPEDFHDTAREIIQEWLSF